MALVARQRHERIETLPAHGRAATVHVRAGIGSVDRLAVEQHLNPSRARAGGAQHEVDVLCLELDVDPGVRDGFAGCAAIFHVPL